LRTFVSVVALTRPALPQVFALFDGLPRTRLAFQFFQDAKRTAARFAYSDFAEISGRTELRPSRFERFSLAERLVSKDIPDPAAAREDSQRKFRLPTRIWIAGKRRTHEIDQSKPFRSIRA